MRVSDKCARLGLKNSVSEQLCTNNYYLRASPRRARGAYRAAWRRLRQMACSVSQRVAALPQRVAGGQRRGPGPCRAANGDRRKDTTIHRMIDAADGILSLPGCFDGLSARCLHAAGFQGAFVSGYAVSAAMLGEPDLGLLYPPEMARRTSQIASAAPGVALLVDADTGGGGILNMQRTVRSLIRSGAKGVVIEDQVWPKRPGHMYNLEVTGMDEFAAKVAAARDEISNDDFFLVARTDARATSAKRGLDDAIARANLYLSAGADAAFIEAPRSRAEMEAICERVEGLKMLNMMEGGLTPMMSTKNLGALGYNIVIHPMAGLYAATKAMMKAYGHLKATGSMQDAMGLLLTMEEFDNLMELDRKQAIEEMFAKPGEGDKLTARVRAPVRSPINPNA